MRPMLSGKASEVKTGIQFPVLASPKIDGVRAMVRDSVVLSRSAKPIPNHYIQDVLGNPLLDFLDGELVVGSATHKNCMQNTTSGVMSREGEPDFTWYVFDNFFKTTTPFDKRYESLLPLEGWVNGLPHLAGRVKLLRHVIIRNQEELDAYEIEQVSLGYEGIMTRLPSGPYKFGRSTAREQYLLKVTRRLRAEAVVIGLTELQHNMNAATINALGYTERSSHAENKVGGDMLGTLIGRDIATGVEFGVGTGFTEADRIHIWNNRSRYDGATFSYEYFPVGVKEKPRQPSFISWRHAEDMS